MSSPQPPDPSAKPPDADGDWPRRFDAPLTVNPRPVQPRSVPKLVPVALTVVVAVVAIGGLVFWLLRPTTDGARSAAEPPAAPPTTLPTTLSPTTTSPEPAPRPDHDARLMQMLPRGYPAGSCEAVNAPESVLAQVNCTNNIDPDGPLSGVYTLLADKAALDAAFGKALQSANRVVCPGNIQSPGPWRRNATPDRVSGTLFCGLREGQPTVVWTDDDRLVVSAVESGPQGPTFPQLYAWWSSHS